VRVSSENLIAFMLWGARVIMLVNMHWNLTLGLPAQAQIVINQNCLMNYDYLHIQEQIWFILFRINAINLL
jgi:hypothetical protein